MTPNAGVLNQSSIAHLITTAAAITTHATFVLPGAGAVIARTQPVPPAMTATNKLDLYVPDVANPEEMAALIDASIGEGSHFDRRFGYHARGVAADTAILPADWSSRALPVTLPEAPGATCICPDTTDISFSRICTWQEEDIRWLAAAYRAGMVELAELTRRVPAITDKRAPDQIELRRRIDALACLKLPGPNGAPWKPPRIRLFRRV